MKKSIVLLMVILCMTGCSLKKDAYEVAKKTDEQGERIEIEYGERIEVEDVIEFLFNDGGTAGAICPYNAYDDSACQYYQDGGVFMLYGEVKNISATKYNLQDVLQSKVTIDGKYEANGSIFLEDVSRTEFRLDSIGNSITSLIQMDKKYCALFANFSMEVLDNAKEATVEIKIKENVSESTSDKYTTYVMHLEFIKQ